MSCFLLPDLDSYIPEILASKLPKQMFHKLRIKLSVFLLLVFA